MNASPRGQMLGPPAMDGSTFFVVVSNIGYTGESSLHKMIRTPFQSWCQEILFVYALEDGDRKRLPDLSRWQFFLFRCLAILFRLYSRILYMAGDWTRDVMFKNKGMF